MRQRRQRDPICRTLGGKILFSERSQHLSGANFEKDRRRRRTHLLQARRKLDRLGQMSRPIRWIGSFRICDPLAAHVALAQADVGRRGGRGVAQHGYLEGPPTVEPRPGKWQLDEIKEPLDPK